MDKTKEPEKDGCSVPTIQSLSSLDFISYCNDDYLIIFCSNSDRNCLLVNYLRLRMVEVRLPEPCSSFLKHLNILHGNINNKSFER